MGFQLVLFYIYKTRVTCLLLFCPKVLKLPQKLSIIEYIENKSRKENALPKSQFAFIKESLEMRGIN